MELDKCLALSLRAEKCLFRVVFPREVTESYIIGLREQRRYLINTNKKLSLLEQSTYVARILESPNDLLMGLFVKGELVGTSGIQTFGEPCQEGISSDASYATMGVFVFDPSDRGKGHGKTMIWAGVYLLNSTLKMSIFRAGLKK